MSEKEKVNLVLKDIDEVNRKDPREVMVDSKKWAVEHIYGLRMTEMLQMYAPEAGPALQIAARGQHIGRWTIPRDSFPMDRAGYLKWRSKLKIYHADQLSEIMEKRGLDPETVAAVKGLIIKKGLKSDEGAAMLEDVVCLVFLKYYLEQFAEKHDRAKVVDILRKTWGKMTERCQQWALSMELPASVGGLVKEALEG